MKSKKLLLMATVLIAGTLAAACTPNKPAEKEAEKKPAATESVTSKATSKGKTYSAILSKTNWQGTKVYDAKGNDLTKENSNFIGLAKYDAKSGYYEFFDKNTGKTRGDEGTFFVTNDGSKRILISDTKKYNAVVDITKLDDKMFTYKRMGKDANGKDVEVFVDHIPYDKTELKFTKGRSPLKTKTGDINTSESGNAILGKTLWNGTVVKDKNGNDVTKQNQMFISLARFDSKTNKYEFFDLKTGKTRGDFGYFDVLFNNKIRAHVSLGDKKYAAVLEITEMNDKKFTYKRMGKDANGKDAEVFVEHTPYKGELKPEFTF